MDCLNEGREIVNSHQNVLSVAKGTTEIQMYNVVGIIGDDPLQIVSDLRLSMQLTASAFIHEILYILFHSWPFPLEIDEKVFIGPLSSPMPSMCGKYERFCCLWFVNTS